MDFEKEIIEQTNNNCEVHTFDTQDWSKSFTGTGIHFHEVHIGGKDDPVKQTRALKTLMSDLGHDHIDVLKMDIEWSEYEVLW